MISIHHYVPSHLSALVSSKANKYLELLEKLIDPISEHFWSYIRKDSFDGYGYCGIVSIVVSEALKNSFASGVVKGWYEKNRTESHMWLYVENNKTLYGERYFLDLTHKQVDSKNMIVVAPTSLESNYGLVRSYILPESQVKRRYEKYMKIEGAKQVLDDI